MPKSESIKKMISDIDDIMSTQQAVKGEASTHLTLITFYCAQIEGIASHYAKRVEDPRGFVILIEMIKQVLDHAVCLSSLSEDEAVEAVTTANNMLQRLLSATH